jgi:hypothetical protein
MMAIQFRKYFAPNENLLLADTIFGGNAARAGRLSGKEVHTHLRTNDPLPLLIFVIFMPPDVKT